ncbi:MAG: Lrp/AsnC family transcriptional regulator [Actinomycetes bacterium]
MLISKNNSVLDQVDVELLNQLDSDSSISNASLASGVGLAASTTLMRVRNLVQRGIIRRFTIDVDYNAIGLGVQAIVFLSLRRQDEETTSALIDKISTAGNVVQIFHVSGSEDLLVHVAVSSSETLREFIQKMLTSDQNVRNAQTHLIFRHIR